MRMFKIDQKPYNDFQLYKTDTMEIEEGVTILIGCNGSGKSTFMKHMKEELENSNIPVKWFDNYADGGTNSISKYMFLGNVELGASMLLSSEGERIYANICRTTSKLKKFFEDNKESNEFWILFDAIGSGLSIDNVIDFRQFFLDVCKQMKEKNKSVYIVIGSNEYEFCTGGTKLFDVQNGKYISIPSYEDYRKFILNSRKMISELNA